MKSYDFYAVTHDGAVYCVGCLPDGVGINDAEVSPIFADEEWDEAPICDACGREHDYVVLLDQDRDDEDEGEDETGPEDTDDGESAQSIADREFQRDHERGERYES